MFDVISEVASAILEAVFVTWYQDQRWWVKIVFWGSLVFIVLAVIYIFFPDLLGLRSR